MPADRAKFGCSLQLDEAEDAVQECPNMQVRACSGTDLARRCYVPCYQGPTGDIPMPCSLR